MEIADESTVAFKHRREWLGDTGTMTVVLSTVVFIPNLQLNQLACSKLYEHRITNVLLKSVCVLTDKK